jgi:hypothetical protein
MLIPGVIVLAVVALMLTAYLRKRVEDRRAYYHERRLERHEAYMNSLLGKTEAEETGEDEKE